MSILKYITVKTSKGKRRRAMASEADGRMNPEVSDTGTVGDGGETHSKLSTQTNVANDDLVHKKKATDAATSEHHAIKEQDKKKGMVYSEMKGDLFSCKDTVALVHCISQDCRMGKGIATHFKRKFGGVEELKAQGVKPGGVAVLQRDKRYVYYLITKVKYSDRPTYNDLQSSLEAMRKHCESHGVSDIAMPRIGCGLDGLQWKRVSPMLRDIFKHTDINITVYTI